MSDGVFLSEALIFDSFKKGKLNLINADCGSGKTTAAFKTIPQKLNIAPHRCLVLINTTSGRDSFVQDGYAYYYDYNGVEWDSNFIPPKDKPVVMTYAFFGSQILKENLSLSDYDYIVCDEIHCLNQYIAIGRSKLTKLFPNLETWQINDLLAMSDFNYVALETIYHLVKESQSWIFALTATADELAKNDLKKLDSIINEVQYSQKLHAYEIFCKFEYAEIEPILRAIVPENRKRLFFFNTIKELQQYKKILIDCGRAAEALWSLETNSKVQMDQKQLTTRDFILTEHRFPDDLQDLLINGAYETAINIYDPDVKEAYIHTSNPTVRVQARNRLRQNLDIVGYYNKDLKKENNKRARKTEKIDNQIDQAIDNIPIEYLDKKLFNNDKEELIKIINFPKKWTSLKKALVLRGFEVIDKSNGNARYSIIKKS